MKGGGNKPLSLGSWIISPPPLIRHRNNTDKQTYTWPQLCSSGSLSCLRCSCWQANAGQQDLYQMALLFSVEAPPWTTCFLLCSSLYHFVIFCDFCSVKSAGSNCSKCLWAGSNAWQIEPYAAHGRHFFHKLSQYFSKFIFCSCFNIAWYVEVLPVTYRQFIFVFTAACFIIHINGTCI